MATLSGSRLRHLVVLTLRHEPGSAEEEAFLAAARALGAIDGVEELEVVRQVSGRNDFRHAISMVFADQAAYDAYNTHPDHLAFVRDRWQAEVTDFLEIDLAALDAG